MAARQARISFFGGLPKDNPIISVDSNLVHYRELTLVGANGSSPAHNAEALRLIASGAVPVDDLITHRLPLDRTPRGVRHCRQRPGDQGNHRAVGSRQRRTPGAPMPSRTVAVGSASGLHARPAALFVAAAAKQPVKVTIRTGDEGTGAGPQHALGAGARCQVAAPR